MSDTKQHPSGDAGLLVATGPAYQLAWRDAAVVISGVEASVVSSLARCLALPPPVQVLDAPSDVTITRIESAYRIYVGTRQYDVTCDVDLFMILATLVPASLMDKSGVQRRMHAAGIHVGDKLVLISGEGLMGKSSISLMARLRGYMISGDDWLLFSDDFTSMLPIPKPLKARMTPDQFASLKAQNDLGSAQFGYVFGETRVLIERDEGFYNDWDRPIPVGTLVFLDRTGCGAAEITPMLVRDALPLLLSQTILCKNSQTLAGVAFARQLSERKVPVYHLNLGGSSPDAALDAILNVVLSCG